MSKWYQDTEADHDVFTASRVRLVRNLEHYPFPVRLSEADGRELVEKLETCLKDIGAANGREFERIPVGSMDQEARRPQGAAGHKRAAVSKEGPESLLLSADERVSITLDGEDHIRLQCICGGAGLNELWSEADRLDDYINERFDYAFHEKYGYLTAYPTNVGTGFGRR